MASNGKETLDEAVEEVKAKMADFDVNEARREAFALADDVRKEAAKKLNAAAERIRSEVREKEVEKEGVEKADEIAAHLEKTAHYLNDHTVEQMSEDATKVVVENPWRAVLIALVIGIVLGMIVRRR
jgi:ElaB/YqjD/DUF883 family membrane-anchored ribosome-binding protein